MKITEVRIKIINDTRNSNLKAEANITFDNLFVIHGVKIIENLNSIFVIMPSREFPDGTIKDIVHPINTEFRNYIKNEVTKKYKEIIM